MDHNLNIVFSVGQRNMKGMRFQSGVWRGAGRVSLAGIIARGANSRSVSENG